MKTKYLSALGMPERARLDKFSAEWAKMNLVSKMIYFSEEVKRSGFALPELVVKVLLFDRERFMDEVRMIRNRWAFNAAVLEYEYKSSGGQIHENLQKFYEFIDKIMFEFDWILPLPAETKPQSIRDMISKVTDMFQVQFNEIKV